MKLVLGFFQCFMGKQDVTIDQEKGICSVLVFRMGVLYIKTVATSNHKKTVINKITKQCHIFAVSFNSLYLFLYYYFA